MVNNYFPAVKIKLLVEYGFLIYFDVLKAKYYNGGEFSLSVYFMAFNVEMYLHISTKPYIGVLGQVNN